jgi:hypothetical protein
MRLLPAALAVPLMLVCAQGAETRQWTDRLGRKFEGELIANDALRVTLALPGRGKVVVPLAQLSAEDVSFVGAWRLAHPRAPLVDPEKLAPWPADAVAADIEVNLKSEDAKARAFIYEGAHFVVRSDLKLPIGVVRDLNAVFEATRAALIALPFGFHSGGEKQKYPVLLFSNAGEYGSAGGAVASGGYYDGISGRMLILLPNLGIQAEGEKRAFDYQKNLFVVKHEVTHQLLRHWRGWLPMWFNEGLAEVLAATPYTRGRYTFSALDTAIGAYVQKWKRPTDMKPLYFTPPGPLMALSAPGWKDRVAGQNAYELYNSAALFTYFLLRHDGAGDGRSVAAMLEALRRGESTEQAAAQVRGGRSDEKLMADFAAFLRRRGLHYEFDVPLPPR